MKLNRVFRYSKETTEYNYEKTCCYTCFFLSSLLMMVMLAMTEAKPIWEAIFCVVFLVIGIIIMTIFTTSLACIAIYYIPKKNFWTCILISMISTAICSILFLYNYD